MILIASDKFKGTLTSVEAGNAIAKGLKGIDKDIRVVAMADGGEGTAQALDATNVDGLYYTFVDTDGQTCAYVPSCGEGMIWQSEIRQIDKPFRQRDTAALGRALSHVATTRPDIRRIYVGIGGTTTADGGLGMLGEMGYTILYDPTGLPTEILRPTPDLLKDIELIGLADVSAPLTAPTSELSALSFLSQKGATTEDAELCKALFERLSIKYLGSDKHGGAGGGIGFALESICGYKCLSGAEYILRRVLSALPMPDIIIGGEGRLDNQTAGGKAIDALQKYGKEHNIPVIVFCGSIADDATVDNAYACISDGDSIPEDAAGALTETVLQTIKKLNIK